ncbi:hypothetical protein ACFE04_017929 [Oxalis oulophora]
MAIFIRFLLLSMLAALILVSAQQQKTLSFYNAFNKLYGDQNVNVIGQTGETVQISLDRYSGSGFVSKESHLYAKYVAAIKLPPGYTAGVVATFYTSNNQVYPNNHDEIDFEFLGNVNGRDWIVQTNIYGNGNVAKGREERFRLWFDPTKDFHTYTIIWTKTSIVFYVDDVPIRSDRSDTGMGVEYPSKPMSLYGTIWDGSPWATSGGKRKIDYNYAPFNVVYSNFIVDGQVGIGAGDLTAQEMMKMKAFRAKYLTYSYCTDPKRNPKAPECARGN